MDAPFGNIQQGRWDHMQGLWDAYRDDTESTEEALREKREILETAILGWARVAMSPNGGRNRASQSIPPEKRVSLPNGPTQSSRELLSASSKRAVETRRRLYGPDYMSEMGRRAVTGRWLNRAHLRLKGNGTK